MATLVPIRIWKISSAANTQSTVSGNSQTANIPPSMFLPNQLGSAQTQSDEITQDGKVYANFYSPIISKVTKSQLIIALPVTSDPVTGLDYVTLGGERRYIRPANNSNANKDTITPIFEFYVNPKVISPSYQKLQTPQRTRGGFETQHWGDNLTDLHIEGNSGGLHRLPPGLASTSGPPAISGQKPIDVTQSLAWQALRALRNIYDSDQSPRNTDTHTLLGINYYDRILVGYFSDFTGPTANAEKQYLVDYSFTMKIQSELTLPS